MTTRTPEAQAEIDRLQAVIDRTPEGDQRFGMMRHLLALENDTSPDWKKMLTAKPCVICGANATHISDDGWKCDAHRVTVES